jgi:ECF transporter S component (folate family)
MDKRAKVMSVKVISYTAALTALSTIANIFTVIMGGGALVVSFTYIPAFIAGAFINPLSGFLTGILGDLLGCLIAPKGAINPIVLVSSGLLGLIPGLVFFTAKKLKVDTRKYDFALTSISFVFVFAICLTLNTIGLYLFYFSAKGKTLEAVFALRMPKQSIILAMNFILTIIIQRPVRKLIKIK